MIDWLIVILSIFAFLLAIVYYDILPRIFGEFYVSVKGYKLRRFQNKYGFYHLQKRYFPGIWMDISRCNIIVPITAELPSYVTWNIETDNKYRRKFIEFKPTDNAEEAFNFEQLLIELFKGDSIQYREKISQDKQGNKYKPFIPGKKDETDIEKDW